MECLPDICSVCSGSGKVIAFQSPKFELIQQKRLAMVKSTQIARLDGKPSLAPFKVV